MPANSRRTDTENVSAQCGEALSEIVKAIQRADPDPNRPRLFFPNGIDLIDLQIDLKNAKVELKIAGPQPKERGTIDVASRRFTRRQLLGTVTDGIDVSHFQGDVNWGQVAAAGKSYSYLKATEGATLVDDKFDQNWSGAKAAGVIRGAYHFFIPSSSVQDQVDNFVSTVGTLDDTDMPPVVDLEKRTGWDNTPVNKRADLVLAWLQGVQTALKCRPMVYTSKSFMDEIMGGSKSLGQYALWVVDYNNSVPDLPDGWSDWTFWQFSETGSCSGVDGNVDLDHFSGDLLALQNFIVHQHGSPMTRSR